MESNKVKSVGEEFIEWANDEYKLKGAYDSCGWDNTEEVLQAMADKINEIIERRILEMHITK